MSLSITLSLPRTSRPSRINPDPEPPVLVDVTKRPLGNPHQRVSAFLTPLLAAIRRGRFVSPRFPPNKERQSDLPGNRSSVAPLRGSPSCFFLGIHEGERGGEGGLGVGTWVKRVSSPRVLSLLQPTKQTPKRKEAPPKAPSNQSSPSCSTFQQQQEVDLLFRGLALLSNHPLGATADPPLKPQLTSARGKHKNRFTPHQATCPPLHDGGCRNPMKLDVGPPPGPGERDDTSGAEKEKRSCVKGRVPTDLSLHLPLISSRGLCFSPFAHKGRR